MNIAILYEHPTWSDSLFEAFNNHAFELTKVNIGDMVFNTEVKTEPAFDLAINRINIMPSASRNPQVAFQTLHYLHWLELSGVRVINGSRSHFIGASKAMQNGIFSSLGLSCPKSIAIYRGEDALAAADSIGYPVVIKPNIGGSGSGVAKYETKEELLAAIRIKSIDLGVDKTGVVQEYIESDGYVYRVEILGNQLFYSIKQKIQDGNFNYCAADGCSTSEGQNVDKEAFDFCVAGTNTGIEVYEPNPSVVNNVVNIIHHCHADVGGVEFFIDQKTGLPCYYDFNPYSNFVSNGESLLGFSPESRFIEFVSAIANTKTQK